MPTFLTQFLNAMANHTLFLISDSPTNCCNITFPPFKLIIVSIIALLLAQDGNLWAAAFVSISVISWALSLSIFDIAILFDANMAHPDCTRYWRSYGRPDEVEHVYCDASCALAYCEIVEKKNE